MFTRGTRFWHTANWFLGWFFPTNVHFQEGDHPNWSQVSCISFQVWISLLQLVLGMAGWPRDAVDQRNHGFSIDFCLNQFPHTSIYWTIAVNKSWLTLTSRSARECLIFKISLVLQLRFFRLRPRPNSWALIPPWSKQKRWPVRSQVRKELRKTNQVQVVAQSSCLQS